MEELGFIIKGYKNECYYWEFVIMLRKALIAAIAVIWSSEGRNIQVLILLSLSLTVLFMPFQNKFLNILENASLFICLYTLLIGNLYYSSSSNGINDENLEEGEYQISDLWTWAISLSAYFFNACFFVFWTYFLLQDLRKLI